MVEPAGWCFEECLLLEDSSPGMREGPSPASCSGPAAARTVRGMAAAAWRRLVPIGRCLRMFFEGSVAGVLLCEGFNYGFTS